MLDMTPATATTPQETVDLAPARPIAYIVAVAGGIGLGLLVGIISALSFGLIMLC